MATLELICRLDEEPILDVVDGQAQMRLIHLGGSELKFWWKGALGRQERELLDLIAAASELRLQVGSVAAGWLCNDARPQDPGDAHAVLLVPDRSCKRRLRGKISSNLLPAANW